jgi:hypothetical protein
MEWWQPDGEDWKTTLKREGFAVVKGVLTGDRLSAAQNGMLHAFEHITSAMDTPFLRDGTRAELRVPITRLFSKHGQLYQGWPPSITHSQFVWDVRQDPDVVDVFSQLHNVPREDLLTSFDAVSMMAPPELTGLGWDTGNSWLHVDRSFADPADEDYCVQGFVNLWPVCPGDATLTALRRSHTLISDAAREFNITERSRFNMLKQHEGMEEWYSEMGCEQVRVMAPEGSVVVWDNRTVHSGSQPERGRPNPSWRGVVYVCMVPRYWDTPPKILVKRIDRFEKGRSTGHHPVKVHTFPALPRTWGKAVPVITPLPPAELTVLGRKLVGY